MKKFIGVMIAAFVAVNIIPLGVVKSNATELDSNLKSGTSVSTKVIDQSMLNKISDINLISATGVTVDQAKAWALKNNATKEFVGIADLYWKYSKDNGGINPAVAYVQAAKEIAFGKFTNGVDNTYHNPALLRSSENENTYKKFNSWDEGVKAHLDHLALYAGANGYPKKETYDPIHLSNLLGKAKTVQSLVGTWTQEKDYGRYIIDEIDSMKTAAINAVQVDSNSKAQSDVVQANVANEQTKTQEQAQVATKAETQNQVQVKPQIQPKASTIVNSTVSTATNTSAVAASTDSKIISNWSLKDGIWYYYDENGNLVKGWKLIKGYWYYMDNNGAMKSGLIDVNGKKYYLDSNGVMQTGWQQVNGTWRYFDENGNMIIGWKLINNKWYYLDSEGIMRTGWIMVKDKWYLMSDNGDMKSGWQQVSGKWYYLSQDGDMKTGWQLIKDRWYYLSTSGDMLTGLQDIDSKTYYLSLDGDMQTGWQVIDGYKYYFYAAGYMAKDTTVDGVKIFPDGRIQKLIVIDPGHNKGVGSGAVRTFNGVTYSETEINMQLALKVKNELEKRGYKVVLTRDENYTVYSQPGKTADDIIHDDLKKRADEGTSLKADFFISIHHDVSDSSSSVTGISTHFSSYRPSIDNDGVVAPKNGIDPLSGQQYDDLLIDTTLSEPAKESREYAINLANALNARMGYKNGGARDHGLYVTRYIDVPSILVECGFLSNQTEAARSANAENQSKFAVVMADELDKIFK